MKYTKEQLISLYEDLKKKFGSQPSKRQWMKDTKTPTLTPIKGRFGNWTKFIKVMGLEPLPQLKGNGDKDKHGYICIWGSKHPNAYKNGHISEHRLKVSKALGRALKKSELVHHINGIKNDNRNCNLLVCSWAYHKFIHDRMANLYQLEHFKNI